MPRLTAPAIRRRTAEVSTSLQSSALPEVLKRIYANRGVSDPQELVVTLDRLLKPDTLKNIDAAAELLADAIESESRVLVIGDFDADGATSCALAVLVLRQMGLSDANYLVPNRFEYGYGLTPEIVTIAAAQMPDLIVTVDNGISSCEGVATAQNLGITVLITDHHLPGNELPTAEVIVNPNQSGCKFPSKSLAGVGVIFYVLSALRKELHRRKWFSIQGIEVPNLADVLDLVALGTVADVVPMDQNNRTLVAAGLARIRSGRVRPGIEALFEVSGQDPRRAKASDLGFFVGPRLNAAGRLEDMSIGVECLLAESYVDARLFAEKLQSLNRERRDIEQSMLRDAECQVEALNFDKCNLPFAITLYDSAWHEGVIGILASRIRDRYHRPVLVFAPAEEGSLKASGRSISGLHLRDALDRVATQYPGLLNKFGGHAMAAGLSLAKDDLETFCDAINDVIAEEMGYKPPLPIQESDGSMASNDLNEAMANRLEAAGPWGQQFPEPMFDDTFTVTEHRIVGEHHLKLNLAKEGAIVEAIAFNIDVEQWLAQPLRVMGALYRMGINEYRGERSLQLIIEEFWPA